ncbi:ISL3 family transposase [Zafaria cholistanensis]|uniref:ISL3 family transposase n=1 Tax=Zafaria cholistanensis TaxID=1682741 RepID=A0A5A7NPK3_9MICC|nr:ISL3 family transposase [Zafaria cholistanensis]
MWRCPNPGCERGTFAEQFPSLAAARGSIPTRAITWAIGQLRREHATILGLARRLGTAWKTLWRTIRPVLERLAADRARFAGVTSLGVDEHIWHHVDPRRRGPKEPAGMVDLTRDAKGRVRARLLDLMPGRLRKAYAQLADRTRPGLPPGRGCRGAGSVRRLQERDRPGAGDTTAVLDAFHVIKLGMAVVDEVRRRVQQDTTGHRGCKGDPLQGIQRILRAGAENLTEKQLDRLATAIEANEAYEEVYVAWRCAPPIRPKDATEGRRRAEKILEAFHSCPVPEVARVGRTLPRWRDAFLLLHHQPRQQRRHGSGEWNHRAPPPPRTRLPQLQLPPPHAPRRRRTRPLISTGCPKSPFLE